MKRVTELNVAHMSGSVRWQRGQLIAAGRQSIELLVSEDVLHTVVCVRASPGEKRKFYPWHGQESRTRSRDTYNRAKNRFTIVHFEPHYLEPSTYFKVYRYGSDREFAVVRVVFLVGDIPHCACGS